MCFLQSSLGKAMIGQEKEQIAATSSFRNRPPIKKKHSTQICENQSNFHR
jgi:hypothetical protein